MPVILFDNSAFGLSEEVFTIIMHIRKINDPLGVGSFLTLGVLFGQTWYTSSRTCFMPNNYLSSNSFSFFTRKFAYMTEILLGQGLK
jgi:hypothetical protein